ncbi:MAG: type II toxin-antitoxin system RelE/ParE family toxin [Bacteroidota bacterium]|nr:type II toxin-antitoxin system RelE/ParE family toxin [Bacteroidota bacterium]
MELEFLKKFSKDVEELNQKSVKLNLIKLIELLEAVENLSNIPHLKKLKGHKTAYRIRLGDYRLGFFYEQNKIILARIVHRKVIYDLFP